MKKLIINEKDYEKAKKLLTENGIIPETEPETIIPVLRRSNAKPGESPAAFGSIWANDERMIESIRAKAWPKRK